MTLRLEIDCFSQYQCQCPPIPGTKVTSEEVAYNLLRCNPALAKYLCQKKNCQETTIQMNYLKKQIQQNGPYVNIVDEKNLKILPSYKYPLSEDIPQKITSPKINNLVSTQTQTLQQKLLREQQNNNLRKGPQHIQRQKSNDKVNSNQKVIQSDKQKLRYYQEHREQSRYLADTAFKNIYNRPVFFNYGHENRHGNKNEGYLKTHNINPHTGLNLPQEQETYHNALVKAELQKLNKSNSNVINTLRTTNNPQKLKQLKKSLSTQKQSKTPQKNMDMILVDNKIYHEKMKKYQHLIIQQSQNLKNKHLSQKRIYNNVQSQRKSINNFLIQQKQSKQQHKKSNNLIISTNLKSNHQNQTQKKLAIQVQVQENILKPRPQPKALPYSNNNLYKYSQVQKNQKNQQNKEKKNAFQFQCPVDRIIESKRQDILSKQCNLASNKLYINPSQKNKKPEIHNLLSPISKNSQKSHDQNCRNECKCCFDKIKQQLKAQTKNDIDLQNRLITSAKKTTFYKNYSLNNEENAELNPHNYRHCCGQIHRS